MEVRNGEALRIAVRQPPINQIPLKPLFFGRFFQKENEIPMNFLEEIVAVQHLNFFGRFFTTN